VEVTTPGEVVVADDSGDVCEPMALYPGNDVDTMFYNAQAIKSLTDLAREVDMSALYRPTLGLAESGEAQRAVEGEHINQRRARKASERVMKWSGRTHGDVVHISSANKGDK
jgi:inosine/xanthosine triphosphate pyrophosphatase family protein